MSATVTILPGDNRDSLRRLIDEGVRVQSCVTDPPYGLSFMGKKWDDTGIERDPEFWRLIHDILLPGGYVFAFSSSRTGHWQACAMEQAGFVMHPMHGWIFSQGFPKAASASKAIDRHLGAERDLTRPGRIKRDGYGDDWDTGSSCDRPRYDVPATPEAAQWEGWAYGTQAQKPALEPIYLGQRPFSEPTGAANLLKHGVGAVNIDGCRVPMNGETVTCVQGQSTRQQAGEMFSGKDQRDQRPFQSHAAGRHPANLMHDGSPEVVALFPSNAGGGYGMRGASTRIYGNGKGLTSATGEIVGFGDEGSAARFFNCFPPDMDPVVYQPKAGAEDRARGNHPTVKPIALMAHLIRHITPPGGTVLDCFAGSGTTGEAARQEGFDCILMEADPVYLAFLEARFARPMKPVQIGLL